MMRNITTSLIMFDRVVTTKAKAKCLKSIIDRLITMAKTKDTVTAIRRLNAYLLDEKASRKIMEVLKEKYQDRPSGFTRVKKEGLRAGDGGEKYSIELI
jgi:large subunit ribosomal protein L17